MRRAEAKAAKQALAVDRIEGLTLSQGAAWITAARRSALARLRDMGLPARRDEYWRFTRPDAFNAALAAPAERLQSADKPVFGDIDRLKIVFIDGILDLEASDDLSAEGIEIEPLGVAGARDIHWVKDLFGILETSAQTPVERPLAALNTASATEGVVMRVTGQVARPVNLQYLRVKETSDATVHHVIRLEEGAELTLLENGPAAARLNKVMEVDVANGATFNHVRAQGRDPERRALTHVFARVGANSDFKSFTLTVNGALSRNEAVIEMVGDDSHATIAGACAGDGEFHHDDTVFITHDAENCESRQVFKKVLKHGATGAFQGKILVRPGAQKTDGYQIIQGLLLDDDSRFLAKPELEIYADDVACSHGATVGAIDEDTLFYLISRGVPRARARDMLVLAFLTEALQEIASEEIRADLLSRLDTWIERHHD